MGSKTILATILVGVVALLSSCSAQTAYQVDGLNSHNGYRQRHGSPSMRLDSRLNRAALDCAVYYASRRKIDHSCRTAGAGENLYAQIGGNQNLQSSVRNAVKLWYDENMLFNYVNPGASFGVTDHFTQVVWKQSTGLGIGAATVNGYTVVVGKYAPHGNVRGGNGGWQYYKENVMLPRK